MSNKYWQVCTTAVADLTDMVQQDVLVGLAKSDPLMAKRLQAVNWEQVADYVITQSVKALAAKHGRTFVAEKSKLRSKKGLAKGKFLGAIAAGDKSLVWIRTDNGVRCVEQTVGYGNDLGAAGIQTLKGDFEQVHREQALLAMTQLVSGGEVETEDLGEQAVFRFDMEV